MSIRGIGRGVCCVDMGRSFWGMGMCLGGGLRVVRKRGGARWLGGMGRLGMGSGRLGSMLGSNDFWFLGFKRFFVKQFGIFLPGN
jgi:hypothetical protein